jgi:hypothetical protein
MAPLYRREVSPLIWIANQTSGDGFNIQFLYLGTAMAKTPAKNRRFITPVSLSTLPRLFNAGRFRFIGV